MQPLSRAALTGLTLGLSGTLAAPLLAAEPATMDVTVTIPRLKVAEYHRPYVAIWVEKVGAPAKSLAVWYDHDMKNNEGTKWLRDVRQWWRVSGRSLRFPADGVTGATRAPGTHKISFSRAQLGALAPGQYVLAIEAAREVGGRELLRIPFSWPTKAGAAGRAAGKNELGAISLSFR
jgi:Predicted periplasmic protein